MTRKVFRDRAAEEPPPHRTHDLQPSLHSAVFATERIGATRYRTKEGYLFCEAVPIARTDEMVYGPGEVPVRAGIDGLVRISRDAKTLFHEDTLRSYQGKPITNDHPNDDVHPGSWKDLAVGVVLNPRRGTGHQADLMLADFLVTDARAIADIEEGKVEVSCGYDAMYEELSPGKGIQTDIVGNHVALVERGRCGQRCAIGDHQTIEEEDEMRTRDEASAVPANQTGAAARIRRQFNDMEKSLKELESSGGDNGVNVHVHLGGKPTADGAADDESPTTLAQITKDMGMMAQSIAALTKHVMSKGPRAKAKDSDKSEEDEDTDVKTDDEEGEEDEDGEEKKEKKTGDSAGLHSSFKDTAAGVEVLVPGMRLPTFDAALSRAKTVDSLCRMRTAALDRFAAAPHGKEILQSLTDGKGFEPLTTDCAATAKLFKKAVDAQKALVNAGNTNGSREMATHDQAGPAINGVRVLSATGPGVNNHSVQSIQARHQAHWKKQGVRT